jgi:hypothetical protein
VAAFNNPNLAILELVANALGPVCDSVIFVGGCATGLLLTQERPDRIRMTEDAFSQQRAKPLAKNLRELSRLSP